MLTCILIFTRSSNGGKIWEYFSLFQIFRVNTVVFKAKKSWNHPTIKIYIFGGNVYLVSHPNGSDRH